MGRRKWCLVPKCKNSSLSSPGKIFINVPSRNTELRLKWLQLAGRDPAEVMRDACVYFCEDHFDKDNVTDQILPTKFACQEENEDKKDVSIVPCAIKVEKSEVIEEYEEQYILGAFSTGASSHIDDKGFPETCASESEMKFKLSETQCCVPSCGSTASTGAPTEQNEITFHEFPSQPRLRSAWSRALGARARPRLGLGLVCSRHFLQEDFCVTASGVRQVRPGVVPFSAVTSNSESLTASVKSEAGASETPLRDISHQKTCDISQPAATRKCALTHNAKTQTSKIYPRNKTHNTTRSRVQLTEAREKLYSCHLCEYKAARRTYLYTHMKTHGPAISCELCAYKTTERAKLNYHIALKHTDHKPLSCNLCEYRCIRNGELKHHKMMIHGEAKPYSCGVCGYGCIQKSRMAAHMITHTGEKPYSCDVCKFRCASKNVLRTHIKTHTGEKPYSCDLCDFKCVIKYYLAIHMRVHTGE